MIKFQSSHLQAGKSQNSIAKKNYKELSTASEFYEDNCGGGVLMERDLREMMGI